jgi:hypothetical protein
MFASPYFLRKFGEANGITGMKPQSKLWKLISAASCDVFNPPPLVGLFDLQILTRDL